MTMHPCVKVPDARNWTIHFARDKKTDLRQIAKGLAADGACAMGNAPSQPGAANAAAAAPVTVEPAKKSEKGTSSAPVKTPAASAATIPAPAVNKRLSAADTKTPPKESQL